MGSPVASPLRARKTRASTQPSNKGPDKSDGARRTICTSSMVYPEKSILQPDDQIVPPRRGTRTRRPNQFRTSDILDGDSDLPPISESTTMRRSTRTETFPIYCDSKRESSACALGTSIRKTSITKWVLFPTTETLNAASVGTVNISTPTPKTTK